MITKYKPRNRRQLNVAEKSGKEPAAKSSGAHPEDKLKVIVLGGLEEIGRNMTVF